MLIKNPIFLLLIAFALPCLIGCGGDQDAEFPDEVFVLGVSSLDWKRIDTLLARGELPHFRRLLEEGVRAAPRGEDPLTTSALWASFETGKSPRKHGVLGAVENLGDGSSVPSRSITRRSMSLWQMASRNGLGVACVGLPGSWPAETVQGQVVSNTTMPTRWTETREVRFEFVAGRLDTYPVVLRSEIEPLIRPIEELDREELARFFVLTERDLRMAFAEPLGSIFARENPMRDFALTYQADRSYLDMAFYLREQYSPEVTAVFLELPAVVSPVYWFFVEPEVYKSASSQAHRFQNTVDEVYRWVDESLGRVMDSLGPRSALMVLSEHGFGTSYTTGDGGPPRPFPEAQPRGVLLMRGPGMREGVELKGAKLVDLAPTILAWMGRPIGSDLDGRPLTGAFTEAFLASHAPSYRTSYESNWKHEERYILQPDPVDP